MSIHESEIDGEGEVEQYSVPSCSVDELIDLTVGPYYINNKLLHAVLKAFAIKLSKDVKFEFDLDDEVTAPPDITQINCMEKFPTLEVLDIQNDDNEDAEKILKLPHSALTVEKHDCITLIELNERLCELEDSTQKFCDNMENLQRNQDALCWETKHINKRVCDMEPQISSTIRRVDCYDKHLYKLRDCCDTVNTKFQEADRHLRQTIKEIDDIKRVNFKIQNELMDIKDCYRLAKSQILELQDRIEIVRKVRDIIEEISEINEWRINYKREIDIMTERYEYLKMVKVNRDDHESELALKANKDDLLSYIETKIFNLKYLKLKSDVDELTNRFNNSTQCIHNNIIDIQSIMKSKTDKCDLKRLQQQIDSDLIVLNKKVNDLIANRLYSYSSAVKTDTLSNVNCLTCTSYAKIHETELTLPKLPELLGPMGRQRYVGGSHTKITNQKKQATTKMRGYLRGFSSNRNASCKITQ